MQIRDPVWKKFKSGIRDGKNSNAGFAINITVGGLSPTPPPPPTPHFVKKFYICFCMCRYPFHGAEHSGLFAKIRKGQFSLPDSLSSRAKCLIRSLLRKEPSERLTTEDVLLHPWLTGPQRDSSAAVSRSSGSRRTGGSGPAAATADTADHVVPEFRPLAVVTAASSPAATATSPAGSSSGGGSTVDPAAAFHLVFRTASSGGSSDQQPGTLANAHHRAV